MTLLSRSSRSSVSNSNKIDSKPFSAAETVPYLLKRDYAVEAFATIVGEELSMGASTFCYSEADVASLVVESIFREAILINF